MTQTPGEDDGASQQDDGVRDDAIRDSTMRDGTMRDEAVPGDAVPADSAGELTPAGGPASWRSQASDDDIDAAFAAIVSGITTDAAWLPLTDAGPQAGAQRHPSAGRAEPDTGAERARRRELRRIERAQEVAAYEAQQAEVQAERDADDAHFTPPEPPPLPRPKGRTIGAVLMLLGGILLLARPGLLAVGFDLTLVIAVVLILGGVAVLLTGIWHRRNSAEADGWDDGAQV